MNTNNIGFNAIKAAGSYTTGLTDQSIYVGEESLDKTKAVRPTFSFTHHVFTVFVDRQMFGLFF